MNLQDLDFQYPAELVATEPLRPSRVLFSEPSKAPEEISLDALIDQIPAGDLLVVNDTKVLPVRVWSFEDDEVLFVERISDDEWKVLFLARDRRIGDRLEFPGGLSGELLAKGLPQTLRFDREISPGYFKQYGEPALPPYIQAARGERHARPRDFDWYQTAWAENPGSSAAPTASLHFNKQNLEQLRGRGVGVANLTLHVGLGTFLPVKGHHLDDHKMHAEEVFLSNETIEAIRKAKTNGGRIWALGTTVTRALEAWVRGELKENAMGQSGSTDLFIRPGFEFQIVDRLLTNFHQPKSTLLALVMAFAGKERTIEAYRYAVENKFRLFSYGDLSVWIR